MGLMNSGRVRFALNQISLGHPLSFHPFGAAKKRTNSYAQQRSAPDSSVTMNTNPLKKGILSDNSAGIGAVSDDMVRKRAAELALINRHSVEDLSESDLDQARRELTGGSDMDPNEAILESAPESERWDPVHGSTGHKVEATPSEDEDEEGRSNGQRLVEQGVREAEHDQMLQAARAQEQKDKA